MQIQVAPALDVLSAFDESLDLTNTLRFIALWHLARYEFMRFYNSSPTPIVFLPQIPSPLPFNPTAKPRRSLNREFQNTEVKKNFWLFLLPSLPKISLRRWAWRKLPVGLGRREMRKYKEIKNLSEYCWLSTYTEPGQESDQAGLCLSQKSFAMDLD